MQLPVYALVTGVEQFMYHTEIYHVYERLPITLNQLDHHFYKKMLERYGCKTYGTSNYILKILIVARDVMPDPPEEK